MAGVGAIPGASWGTVFRRASLPMTEPTTDGEIVAAVKERFDCAHVSVGSWRDEHGIEWFGASLTWDQHPHTGTTWTLLGCCQTREALLAHVQTVAM